MKFYFSLFYRLLLSNRAQKSISTNYLVKLKRICKIRENEFVTQETRSKIYCELSPLTRSHQIDQTIERKEQEHGAVCGAKLQYSVRTGGVHVFFSRWPQIKSDLGKKTKNGELLALQAF